MLDGLHHLDYQECIITDDKNFFDQFPEYEIFRCVCCFEKVRVYSHCHTVDGEGLRPDATVAGMIEPFFEIHVDAWVETFEGAFPLELYFPFDSREECRKWARSLEEITVQNNIVLVRSWLFPRLTESPVVIKGARVTVLSARYEEVFGPIDEGL